VCADPQPAFWLIGAEGDIPRELLERANTLIARLP
jgi:hypothetical protein